MNKNFPPFFGLFLMGLTFIVGCNSESNTAPITKKDSTHISGDTVSVDFFPVTDYLLSELKALSLSSNQLYRTDKTDSIQTTNPLKKDTASLTAEYKDLLNPVIDTARIGKSVKLAKFMDETLHLITLSFDNVKTINTYPEWHDWTVYIDPEKSTVKKIYLTKFIDATHRLQITWTTGEGCLFRNFETGKDGNLKLTHETIDRWTP